MIRRVAADSNAQHLAMKVAKQLKTEHRIDDAPAVDHYEFLPDNGRLTSGGSKIGENGPLSCTQDLLNFDAETGRGWAA